MALTVAQALTQFSGNTLADGSIIADTGRLVAENIAALHPLVLANKIASIQLTNGGRTAVMVTSAEVAAFLQVLDRIAGPYSLQLRLTAAEAAGATLSAGFDALGVWDTGANIAANLPAIQALWRAGTAKKPKIKEITKTLSSDSDFSMKNPVRYSIPLSAPRLNQTHTPNSSPAPI